METIDQNNELSRLLDEEQAEIHRILVAMTRAIASQSVALLTGASVLAEADAHQAIAKFALDMDCVRPSFVGSQPVGRVQDERFRGVKVHRRGRRTQRALRLRICRLRGIRCWRCGCVRAKAGRLFR